MPKYTITIVSSEDIPPIHLLDRVNWEVYESKGNEMLFTMIKKEKEVPNIGTPIKGNN